MFQESFFDVGVDNEVDVHIYMAPVASLISSERAVSCFLNLAIRSGDHRATCKIVFLKLDVTFQEVFSILVREAVKKRIFYSQADRKGCPPPLKISFA